MGTTGVMPPVLPLNHIKCRVHKTYPLALIEDYKPKTMSHSAKEERKKERVSAPGKSREKNDKSYLEKEKEINSTIPNNNTITKL